MFQYAFLKLEECEFFEISLVVSGVGIHRVLDKDIPCNAGDIFIIPPHIPHKFFVESQADELTVRH
jgi:cupin superfamily acireductone dioxygenase involved in methionine salvage